ncbi:hypothetical protein A0J61_11950, partial [Choanephora cucurbitarum]
MIEVQASSMPDILVGEFKNVLLPSQRLRGVDWSVFIQFILPTLVVEQIELQQFNRVPKKKLDENFTINQHYLEHLPKDAKEVGLAQTNCVSLERRIQELKRKIKSTRKVEENAANVIVKAANKNFIRRSKIVYRDEDTMDVKLSFCHAANINSFDAYKLKPLLAEAIGTNLQDISSIINYATTVKFLKKVFY